MNGGFGGAHATMRDHVPGWTHHHARRIGFRVAAGDRIGGLSKFFRENMPIVARSLY